MNLGLIQAATNINFKWKANDHPYDWSIWLSRLQKELRDKHNKISLPYYDQGMKAWECHTLINGHQDVNYYYESYELALEFGLSKILRKMRKWE